MGFKPGLLEQTYRGKTLELIADGGSKRKVAETAGLSRMQLDRIIAEDAETT